MAEEISDPAAPPPTRLSLRCLFGRHRPRDRRANWNGEHYISNCEFCNKPIKRLGRRRWRIDRWHGARA